MDIKSANKREYMPPMVEQIQLDNEISLALASDPPVFEKLHISQAPEYFNNDPMKNS